MMTQFRWKSCPSFKNCKEHSLCYFVHTYFLSTYKSWYISMWIILILTLQIAAPNLMNPANRHQLEDQQSSSCRSAHEQYISAVTELKKKQPIRPIAIRSCDIANSNAYYKYFNVTNPHGTLLHEGQPRLQYPNTLGQIVPAVTSDTSSTAYSKGYSSVTNSGLTVSPLFNLSAAHSYLLSRLPPGPVPLRRPELRGIPVASSRVSNSSLKLAIHIVLYMDVWMCRSKCIHVNKKMLLFRCVLWLPLFLEYLPEFTEFETI
jgi:hypothetical protein